MKFTVNQAAFAVLSSLFLISNVGCGTGHERTLYQSTLSVALPMPSSRVAQSSVALNSFPLATATCRVKLV